jgi:hypothetical protein
VQVVEEEDHYVYVQGDCDRDRNGSNVGATKRSEENLQKMCTLFSFLSSFFRV